MLALLSVWISLAALLLSLGMVMYRPWFNDYTIPLVVMFGAPGGLCLAGMVLWNYRHDSSEAAAVAAQRLQARVAIGLSLAAAGIVYALVLFAERRAAGV
jgi:hypothetical protein